MNKIERAHQMYRDGKYAEALDYYTDSLAMAKTKPQKIALHSNRAACYLKLHDFDKAAKECTSVLELDHQHTGALMLRAQTLVTLKEYHSALFDVNRLIELNPSSEVYQNLQARLKTQLSLAPIPEDEAEFEEDDDYIDEANWEENEEEEQDSKEVEDHHRREDDAIHDAAIADNNRSGFENVRLTTEPLTSQDQTTQRPPDQQSLGWQTIPKPKGHSHLDYSRWDRVQDDSSEEENDDDDDGDDEDSQPQYRFRVKTVGVRAVK
ncbi:sperm-associated antigen 1 [Sesamum indicum]|uniref:Sperm-associated antigen 1 n=1 Tax=Sesamum indicum TaxID=4182 RepID=A0A6I9UML2_SESIN|nr:sperm-associated antigen 1 [Sesamum indicum]